MTDSFSRPRTDDRMTAAECPGCGKRVRVPDAAVGKRVRCKLCGEPFRVPADPDGATYAIRGNPADAPPESFRIAGTGEAMIPDAAWWEGDAPPRRAVRREGSALAVFAARLLSAPVLLCVAAWWFFAGESARPRPASTAPPSAAWTRPPADDRTAAVRPPDDAAGRSSSAITVPPDAGTAPLGFDPHKSAATPHLPDGWVGDGRPGAFLPDGFQANRGAAGYASGPFPPGGRGAGFDGPRFPSGRPPTGVPTFPGTAAAGPPAGRPAVPANPSGRSVTRRSATLPAGLERGRTVGGRGGWDWEEVTAGRPIVGLRVRGGSWGGEEMVAKIEPLADGPVTPVFDRRTREVVAPAPDGFTLGGLDIAHGEYVYAVRPVWVRPVPDQDADDAAAGTSVEVKLDDWIGDPGRRTVTRLEPPAGGTVVGFHGHHGTIVDSLGLVIAE